MLGQKLSQFSKKIDTIKISSKFTVWMKLEDNMLNEIS